MITTLLHLLRLFPFLCVGHRQLALENLALRHQLAVYKENRPAAPAAPVGSPSGGSGWPGSGVGGGQPSLIVLQTPYCGGGGGASSLR